MDESELCPICDEKLFTKETVNIGVKGLITLTNVSKRLQDGKLKKWEEKNEITAHKDCRKDYIREQSIKAKERKRDAEKLQASKSTSFSPVKKRLKSSNPKFDYKTLCLFCGNVCDEAVERKLPVNRRRQIFKVATLDIKNNILQRTENRQDDLAKTVRNRVCAVFDLVAEEAR